MLSSKIGFIGCGNIASAIISGAISSGYIKPEDLRLFDTDLSKSSDLSTKYGGTAYSSAEDLVTDDCDYVFLTVKPQVYDIVLELIKCDHYNCCFVAVAAGITVGHIKSILGEHASVIRVMPNTPLMYGEGASAIVNTPPVSSEQFSFVKGLFECCGTVIETPEKDINTVTAISGSAPAYVMRFIKDFTAFAIRNGMSDEAAATLATQAVFGTAKMLKESETDIDTLIKNVTSPNGTTEAGLKMMDELGFDGVVEGFLDATLKRAEELTK